MKVCLICEGSYPYVAGGVAGWVQMLCENLADIEFVIWSIATTREEMSRYQYELPPNVVDVKTIWLGADVFYSNRTIRLSAGEANILRELVTDSETPVDWQKTLEFIRKYHGKLADILLGKDFYNICLDEYRRMNETESFVDFLWNFRAMYFPFMNVMKEELVEADIYHSLSTGYAGILGSLASYIRKKPFLLSEHGIYTREREEDIIRSDWVKGNFKEIWIDFFKKISLIAYHQADVVTSLFSVNQTMQIELGCPAEKIRIIPNGVAVEEYENLVPKNRQKKAYFHIGTMLRVVPIKDVKTMLLAFEIVQEQMADAYLSILGGVDEDPEYYRECLEMVHALSLKNVEFLGRVDVKEYLPDIDLLLLSSISEGQPLAVLEGMAAGVPFVCTNVGDCKSLLEGNDGDDLGSAGYIVPVMDSRAMADAILYLARHPQKREKMGETGKKRAATYYQKHVFLEKYRELYQSLGEEKAWQG